MKMIFLGLFLVTNLFIFPPFFLKDADAGMKRNKMGLIGPVHTVREELEFSAAEPDDLIHETITVYDREGRWIEFQSGFLKAGERIHDGSFKDVISYDSKTNEEERISFTSDGSIASKTVTSYNGGGDVLEERISNLDGSRRARMSFTYDPQGRLVDSKHYWGDTLISHSRTEHKVDSMGNRVKIVSRIKSHDPDRQNAYVSTLDKQGNSIEIVHYNSDGSIKERIRNGYKYNEKGMMTERYSYNEDDSLAWKDTYSYEFDSFGNWIKETAQHWVGKGGKLKAEPPRIKKRTITYYDSQTPEKESK